MPNKALPSEKHASPSLQNRPMRNRPMQKRPIKRRPLPCMTRQEQISEGRWEAFPAANVSDRRRCAHRLGRSWLLGSALALLLQAGLPQHAPALEVILVRHADKDTSRGDYNLSPRGFQRAIQLARLIPGCLGAPSSITTFVLDPRTSKNARSYQTAVPLAVATGVPIQLALQSVESSEAVGRQLRQRRGASSERLVLIWEHQRMPELARGLGWPAMPPIADEDFDQLYVFRFRGDQAPPAVSRYRQSAFWERSCFRNAPLPWEMPPAAPLAEPLALPASRP